jgi:SM-20-related protein
MEINSLSHQNMENKMDTFELIVEGLSEGGFAAVDNFLTSNEGLALLEELISEEKQGFFKHAGIGKQQDHMVNQNIRGDLIRWIDSEKAGPAAKMYAERIKALMDYLNRTCYLGLKDFEMHYAIYQVGSFYKRHLDQFRKNDHRKISIICYLNPVWTEENGGQLIIYKPTNGQEQKIVVQPLMGRLVCFRSDKLEHEVKPALKDRYSITGWMLDQLSSLTFF